MFTASRFDMYTPIHKSLRRVMFETAISLARTDFTAADEDASASRASAPAWRTCASTRSTRTARWSR